MTKVVTTTATWADEPGTPAEVVGRYVARGWQVVEVREAGTLLQHPELTGSAVTVVA